ncbi:hypothetical protein [Lacipirellula sp.]|uniref:hypothetical protein n=1 Tax=Lacipirellula sp. TaxID=2691419 RepID=UPI003D1263DD
MSIGTKARRHLRRVTQAFGDIEAYEASQGLRPRPPIESRWIGYALSELAFVEAQQVTKKRNAYYVFEAVVIQPGFILAAHVGKEPAWHYAFVFCQHMGHGKKASARFADAVMRLFLRRATCPMPWTDEDLLSPTRHEGNVPEPNWPEANGILVGCGEE